MEGGIGKPLRYFCLQNKNHEPDTLDALDTAHRENKTVVSKLF